MKKKIVHVIVLMSCITACGTETVSSNAPEVTSKSSEVTVSVQEENTPVASITDTAEDIIPEEKTDEKLLLSSLSFTPGFGGNFEIVTTSYPLYEWTTTILGQNPSDASVTMLYDGSSEVYKPSKEDLEKIAGCDIFIYTGGKTDTWVEQVEEDPDRIDINLMDYLPGTNEDNSEYSCLSLMHAQNICWIIEKCITDKDTNNYDIYYLNTLDYTEKLQELDLEYRNALYDSLPGVFACDCSLIHMFNDYGLTYYVADPAAEDTWNDALKAVNSLGNKYIFVNKESDEAIADDFIEQTRDKNMEKLSLNIMREAPENSSYIEIMSDNLNMLKKALTINLEETSDEK